MEQQHSLLRLAGSFHVRKHVGWGSPSSMAQTGFCALPMSSWPIFHFFPHGNVFLSVQHQVTFLSNMHSGVTYTVFPLMYFCMFLHVWALKSDTAAALWIDKQELAFICHSRLHFLQERREERSYFWPQVCKMHLTFLQYKRFAQLPGNDKFAAAEWHQTSISQQNCKCTCAWKWMNCCCIRSWALISICAVGLNNEPIECGVLEPAVLHLLTPLRLESANLQFNSQTELNTWTIMCCSIWIYPGIQILIFWY